MSKVHHNTVVTDGESTYYVAADAAEGARQAAIAAASTQAQIKTADIAYHRSIVKAATVAGLGHLGGPSREALWELTGSFS